MSTDSDRSKLSGLRLAADASCAIGQQSLADSDRHYPLWPPISTGDPERGDGRVPMEVTYDYEAIDPGLFEGPIDGGLDRWAPILPPLVEGGGLGEGDTPLVDAPSIADHCDLKSTVYIKDESRNPTWSQKDRLIRCASAGAIGTDAAGIVVSSTGNHGASAAAYAGRLGLPCVVVTAPETPNSMCRFVRAYGAALVRIEGGDERVAAVDRLASEFGFHAVSSRTPFHTGHPFGPEGYKTIAYEIVAALDRAPGSVFVPTCYGEILYGVWKGFRELDRLGVAAGTPRMIPCEPAARAPLTRAIETNDRFVAVDPAETMAKSIAATRDSYRGHVVLEESGGRPIAVSDRAIESAADRLGAIGLWQERSGAAGVAGLRAAAESWTQPPEGPIVCIATSSGFKNPERTIDVPTTTPATIDETLELEYDLDL